MTRGLYRYGQVVPEHFVANAVLTYLRPPRAMMVHLRQQRKFHLPDKSLERSRSVKLPQLRTEEAREMQILVLVFCGVASRGGAETVDLDTYCRINNASKYSGCDEG